MTFDPINQWHIAGPKNVADLFFLLRGRTTLHEIEKRTGISRSKWSRIEKGAKPDLETVRVLGTMFSVDYNLFMNLYEQTYHQKFEEPHLEEVSHG